MNLHLSIRLFDSRHSSRARWVICALVAATGCAGSEATTTPSPPSPREAPTDDAGTWRDAASPDEGTMVTRRISVGPLFPNSGGDFGDYVTRGIGPVATWADQPCSPDVEGASACARSGLHRGAIIEGAGGCDGLSAVDALGAFDWSCLEIDGDVLVHSVGFAREMGLADVLDRDGFRPNRLFAAKDDVRYESEPATWWSDPVLPLSLQADQVTVVDTPGIRIISGDLASGGVRIEADDVSLIGIDMPTVHFAGPPNSQARSGRAGMEARYLLIIDEGGARRAWVEGIDFDGAGSADIVAFVRGASESRFHRLEFRNGLDGGFATGNGAAFHGNGLRFVQAHDNGVGDEGFGIRIAGAASTGNLFEDIRVADNRRKGLVIGPGADGQVLRRVTAEGHALHILHRPSSGIVAEGSDGHLITDVTTRGNQFGTFLSTSDDNRVFRLRSYGDSGAGFQIRRGRGNAAHDLVFEGSEIGIRNGLIESEANDNSFTRVYAIDVGDTAFDSEGHGHTLVHATSYGAEGPGFRLDGSSYLIASVVAIDGHRTGFAVPADAVTLVDAVAIGNAVAGIAIDGDDQYAVGVLGLGENGTDCRIHPTVVRSGIVDATCTDTGADGTSSYAEAMGPVRSTAILRRAESFSSVRRRPGVFVADALCPEAVRGDRVIADQQTPPNRFLSAAWELVEDGVGDDDGLCESHEACVYAKELGYGAPPLGPPVTCRFEDGESGAGGVVGVTMYGEAG